MSRKYFVYVMTNKNNTTLYTGVTSDLSRRVMQHQAGEGGWFTKKYALHKLVYFEETGSVIAAIEREKQIKAGSRKQKICLIETANPEWKDLSEGWF